MVKTRSQTGNSTIKKEEVSEPTLGVAMTTRSKITKKKPPIINNRPLPAQQVKVEEDTDTKSLLQSSSKYSKRGRKPRVSQEQINQLIRYVVNDNMSVHGASRKVNISKCSAYTYFDIYKNDPEKRIPVPGGQLPKIYTQEQIGNFIRYINDDKMTVKEASAKANFSYGSGMRYYTRYLKDPNRNIPVPQFHQKYTQDQKKKFIGYIINDKMSIAAASRKAKMNNVTGYVYYCKYFKEQNSGIAAPSHIATHRCYTQEQKKQVISYIVDDKMSIRAASRKANLCQISAARYYQQYLKDNNIGHYVPQNKPYSQDKKNEFIRYIVDDKISVRAASKKANVGMTSSYKYYYRYLNSQNRAAPT